MSSFFTAPKKRKRTENAEAPTSKRALARKEIVKPKKKVSHDEDISGSDSESDDDRGNEIDLDDASSSSGGSDGEEETAAERRLRLAERYLENIREEVDEVGFDAEDVDRDLIAERLQEDVAEGKGRIYRSLAKDLSFATASHTLFKNNSQSVTSIATCPPYAYTVSKDISLVKWKLQDLPKDQWQPKPGKKSKKASPPPKRRPESVAFAKGDKNEAKNNAYKGHVDAILCVAASQDGKFVVTGGRDRRIVVWDAATLTPLRVFSQHRDAVTGLAFRRGTNQLYSASKDRTIKIWSLDELAYVETLFGHQDEVVDVAALAQERCVSVGARDRTARLWKVVEETQLVFRGGGDGKKSRNKDAAPRVNEGSMDRVAMIDEEMFVTGSDNGCISLWVVHKKKPIHTLQQAHGVEEAMSPEEYSAETCPKAERRPWPQPRWITALATIPFSDVILPGSWDGQVRAWRVSEDRKKIESLGVVGKAGYPHGVPKSEDVQMEEAEMADGELGDEDAAAALVAGHHKKREEPEPVLKGVINDISIFERGERGKDGACVVVAVGKEHRLGRWKKLADGAKNGAYVFEIPRL